jgi:hypothetical protein
MITPNNLSVLGIIHTAISVLALIAGLVSMFSYGKIDMTKQSGRLFILLTIFTCVTGFPIMRFGHPTPGHYLGVILLIILPIGIYAKQLRIFGKLADYVQLILLSTTFFFSFIPAINETLTRLPLSSPIASGPDDPIIKTATMILMVIFIVTVLFQVIKLKKLKKSAQTPNPAIN